MAFIVLNENTTTKPTYCTGNLLKTRRDFANNYIIILQVYFDLSSKTFWFN